MAHLSWHTSDGTPQMAHLSWHTSDGTSQMAHLSWHTSDGTPQNSEFFLSQYKILNPILNLIFDRISYVGNLSRYHVITLSYANLTLQLTEHHFELSEQI